MSKINILDSSVYNRISAGEVVERPASVVKELIENSLDAKASNIIIEIAEGGTKLIKITDNGTGIEKEDLKKAFLPHATSKIAEIQDLDEIDTLGFRGEALASIASVAKVELFSKTKEAEVGGLIKISGGVFEEESDFACIDGTSISVRDLFFNTPARLKFLKGNKQEENAITNIVNRLMLANPNISFKYIIDGKLIYNSNLLGLSEKIYTIYGKEYLNNLIKIDYKDNNYSLNGYISLPNFCKANKTYQTLIVNGRYVNNSLVSVAIANAYENFLMKGKFPVFILNLTINPEDIDVNVHPSKMEIKFKTTNDIYKLFYSVVIQTLNEANAPVIFNDNKNDNEDNFFYYKEPTQPVVSNENLKTVSGGFSFSQLNELSNEINNINVSMPTYKEDLGVLKSDESTLLKKEVEPVNTKYNDLNVDLFNNYVANNVKPKQEVFDSLSCNIIGSIFNTYILVESEDKLYIIDQHAGHERVLYDKLIQLFDEKKIISQDLLVPYIFNVNEQEDSLIAENLNIFKLLGFNIEEFGRLTYKITSIPSILDGINLDSFIKDCLKDTTKISNTNEVIKNKFAKMACRAAVKGGDKLSKNEIEVLLSQISKNKTILLCPHGRPICIELSKYEIEKMFKRIL